MKNTKVLAVILSAFILASCGTSHDVVDGGLFQKRKYNKGYHISKKGKGSTTSKENDGDFASVVTIENNEDKLTPVSLEPISTNNDVVAQTEMTEVAIQEDVVSEKNTVAKKSGLNLGVAAKNGRSMKRSGLNIIEHRSPVSMDKSDNTSDTQKTTNNTLLLVIIAIFIPFLAVGLYDGLSTRFWISLVLTLLFWLPGFIYALIVILE